MVTTIALISKIAGGKDFAVGILSDYTWQKRLEFARHLSYSIKLDEVLKTLGIAKPTRELKQSLGIALDETLLQHEYSLTRALYTDWQEKGVSVQLISGIRFPHQLQEWKNLIPDMCTIYIDATDESRWEHNNLRRHSRKLKPITMAEFMREHNSETEQHIEELKSYATMIISNNGTIDEFTNELKRCFDQFV